jgi:deoxyribose-phosphate aldolase
MGNKKNLNSTYLKTTEQTNIREKENNELQKNRIQETLFYGCKLVMLRLIQVSLVKMMIVAANSKVANGTEIDVPNGSSPLEKKLAEAQTTIKNGADALAFVVDYTLLKNEAYSKRKEQIIEETSLALKNHKTIKWIIKINALRNHLITQIIVFIKKTIINPFQKKDFAKILIKSSIGFYKTPDGVTNGATFSSRLLPDFLNLLNYNL